MFPSARRSENGSGETRRPTGRTVLSHRLVRLEVARYRTTSNALTLNDAGFCCSDKVWVRIVDNPQQAETARPRSERDQAQLGVTQSSPVGATQRSIFPLTCYNARATIP
jgi:hypothetical protein